MSALRSLSGDKRTFEKAVSGPWERFRAGPRPPSPLKAPLLAYEAVGRVLASRASPLKPASLYGWLSPPGAMTGVGIRKRLKIFLFQREEAADCSAAPRPTSIPEGATNAGKRGAV